MSPHVSIIIPVYNEARFIETVLRKVAAVSVDKEMIVVDDGSTDTTPAILARLQQEMALRVITQPRNQGKGSAVRTGMQASRGELLLIQDADLEYDPADYPALLKPFDDDRTSIVYGSRFLGAHRATFFWHRLGNGVITLLVNLLFNASLTDVETGYKVFRRPLVEHLSLRASGFEFEVEITCKVLRQGQSLFEVPITYYGRSYAEGKKITWLDGVQALWVIVCCRMNPWY